MSVLTFSKGRVTTERNGACLRWTYGVPQQVNTILCVIHSRKPQTLDRNEPRTFVF